MMRTARAAAREALDWLAILLMLPLLVVFLNKERTLRAVEHDVREEVDIHQDAQGGEDVQPEEEAEHVVIDGEGTQDDFQKEEAHDDELQHIEGEVRLGAERQSVHVIREQGEDRQGCDTNLVRDTRVTQINTSGGVIELACI